MNTSGKLIPSLGVKKCDDSAEEIENVEFVHVSVDMMKQRLIFVLIVDAQNPPRWDEESLVAVVALKLKVPVGYPLQDPAEIDDSFFTFRVRSPSILLRGHDMHIHFPLGLAMPIIIGVDNMSFEIFHIKFHLSNL